MDKDKCMGWMSHKIPESSHFRLNFHEIFKQFKAKQRNWQTKNGIMQKHKFLKLQIEDSSSPYRAETDT